MNAVMARNMTHDELARYADFEPAARDELARRGAAEGEQVSELQDQLRALEEEHDNALGERDDAIARASSAEEDRDLLVDAFKDLRQQVSTLARAGRLMAADADRLLDRMKECEDALDVQVAA